MNRLFLTLLTIGYCGLAMGAGIPKIEFEQTVIDFGKISETESVSGSFKFKNAGDGVLTLEKPTTSCGCTITALKTSTLNPGETGEVPFTLMLRGLKGTLWKSIRVPSNDPQNPISLLSIKAQYTPLYDVSPLVLRANVLKGGTASDLSVTVSRTDGKPVGIQRIETSNPSITAKVDSAANADAATARIQVGIAGSGTPRRINGFVSVYAGENATTPVGKVYVTADIKGDLNVSPQQLFWSITDPAKAKAELPEALVTRRATIVSTNGKPFELKNPQSSIPSMNVELNPLKDGTGYEIIARLNDIPTQSVNGSITFDTSLESEPRIEVPVLIRLVQMRRRTLVSPRTRMRPPIGPADEAETEAARKARAAADPAPIPVPSR